MRIVIMSSALQRVEWRAARPEDAAAIVALSLALHREDPGPTPVGDAQVRRTLDVLRREPWRGRAVVLDVDGRPAGYALLVAFWSNELGGEVCEVDELFVEPALRGRGFGSMLFEAIARGDLWTTNAVAIALGVTPGNANARRLYERVGFAAVGVAMVRRLS
jgi:GNAT superfamily N-acetyltransferase